MKKIFLITMGFFSCAAGQSQVPLELDRAFYKVKCSESGDLTISVRTHYCKTSGLYSIRAKAVTLDGKKYDVFLKSQNECSNDAIWEKNLTGHKCKNEKDIQNINVTAYVDPIIWKPAIDAKRKNRAK